MKKEFKDFSDYIEKEFPNFDENKPEMGRKKWKTTQWEA